MNSLIRGMRISPGSLRLQLTWALCLGLLWWLMTRGDAGAWMIGLPAVLLAVMANATPKRPALPHISVPGLIAFVFLFLRESMRGGVDVARRVLAPALRIRPGFVNYRIRLADHRARVLLINCISLLPGTLAVRAEHDLIRMHVLDLDVDPAPGLRRLEQAIAGALGITLEDPDA